MSFIFFVLTKIHIVSYVLYHLKIIIPGQPVRSKEILLNNTPYVTAVQHDNIHVWTV